MTRVNLIVIVAVALALPIVYGEAPQLERRAEKPKGRVLVRQLPTTVEGVWSSRTAWLD
jgi:hypothetical protein